MKFALSTNWCNQKIESGEEIADLALKMGFDALELGFNTSAFQIEGFKRRLSEIPVVSVHAYAPVPISAPCGSPELYSLASANENERALARLYLAKTVEMASVLCADTVILHAGRISISSLFDRRMNSGFLHGKLSDVEYDARGASYLKVLGRALSRRRKRAAKVFEIFKAELEAFMPVLLKNGIVLALENLPYLEGFPDERESLSLVEHFKDAPVKAWFDTGHHHVRMKHGWVDEDAQRIVDDLSSGGHIRGMHLNDVKDYFDDHLEPGAGAVDFAALSQMMANVRHIVFEPKSHVSEVSLLKSLALLKTYKSDFSVTFTPPMGSDPRILSAANSQFPGRC